ncbi:uncharacterized protein [Nyctibius grandis]|uniref:uncharacterized protein n=1 Tax=Nyctibius grandis TaxID=48427 RepID=UPI0035BC7B48
MRIFLVWTLFPGGWAVTGPAWVTAEQGGSLAVSCNYEPGYELYPKFWCRPGFLWFCFTYIAQTDGSEVMVTQGRVSIGDNHTSRSFTVTLGDVAPEDAGWYSCGVRRSQWLRPRHTTEVMVSAGKARLGGKQGRGMEPVTWSQRWGQGLPSQGDTGAGRAGTSSLQLIQPQPRAATAWDLDKLPTASPDLRHLFLRMHPPVLGPPCLQHPQGPSRGQAGQLADMQVPQTPSSLPRPYSSSSIISFLLPRSQLSVTHLLFLLSIKVPVALALVCGAAWVRSRRRSHHQENLQLLEVAGSTGAPSCPPTPEPQGRPPAPLPRTLPVLHHPPRPPHAGSRSALGASPRVKPWPLLAAPALEKGGFGVQRAHVC